LTQKARKIKIFKILRFKPYEAELLAKKDFNCNKYDNRKTLKGSEIYTKH